MVGGRGPAQIKRIGAVAVVLLALMAVPHAARAQADDGLELTVDTRYEMRPERGDVSVVLDITAVNTLTDATDEFGVTRYYFDEVVFAIPIEAVGLTASDDGGELSVEVAPRHDEGIAEATVSLRSRLYSGETRHLEMSFALGGTPPRSDGDIRVDGAYGWFFLWAYGDPGSATVSAVIPEPFDVQVVGDEMREGAGDEGERVFLSGAIDDPFAWVSVVSARNDDALESTSFEVNGTTIELESWPSDPEWATEVEEILARGIPVLSELTGRTWATDVTITESIEPSIHGYGGWYVSGSDSIEIGEELDAHLVLHEISHAWFDESLFVERWITEGLADAFADVAVERIGADGWEQDSVTRSALGNLPLNDWQAPTFDERTVDATEDYAYAASWHVIDGLVEEIGVDGMRMVMDAALSDTIAYHGDSAFDYVAPRDDWRRFLDLLEEVGGSTQALSLFDTWVVDADEERQLDDRYLTRMLYREVADVSGSWALPPELRRAMSSWDFETARAEIAKAGSVLEARDRMTVFAAQAEVVPPSLESRFEAGEDADLLVSELEAQMIVAEEILVASELVRADRPLLEAIGLYAWEGDELLDSARRSFESGQLEAARDTARAIAVSAASAARTGQLRVAALALVLVVLTVTVLAVRRNRRKRSSIAEVPESVATR